MNNDNENNVKNQDNNNIINLNEDQEKINEYISSIVNIQLKEHLSILISIIENKLHKIKYQFFIFLKNNKNSNKSIAFYDYEKITKNLKMSILLHKIKKNGMNLLQIYKSYRLRKKLKNFLIWKEKLNLEKSYKKMENAVKAKYTKLYEKNTSETMITIKKNEKNIEELKSQEKKITQNIKQKEKQKEEINKNISELEQKIEEVIKVNEKLEKEKNEKETLANSNTFSSLNKKDNNEEIIKELETRIFELDKEKNERDAYFKNFHEEMINMMILFEQKTQKIMKMKNEEHPQKRLEINTGGEMFDPLNNYNDFVSSDTIKGNAGKKFFGNEKQLSSNKISNLDNGKGKSKNKNSTEGIATTNDFKGNENNREIFINYTDNFKSKI